jgi:hypothetical protein
VDHDFGWIPDTERAYSAGLIDGEGCIAIAKQTYAKHGYPNNYALTVRVMTTDTILPNYLYGLFGGHLKVSVDPRGGRKRVTWAVTSARAESMLRVVLPHLRLKKPQAMLALEFRSLMGVGGRAMTEENRQKRAWYCDEMKRLKRVDRTEQVAARV